YYYTAPLFLLGMPGQARETLKRSQPVGAPSRGEEFAKAQRQFSVGELSEEGLLAKAGWSRFKQFDAHLSIGLSRLAVGDRTGARQQFQKAVDTRTYWTYGCFWCEMFLSRMDKDPTWPPWIPVQSGKAQPK